MDMYGLSDDTAIDLEEWKRQNPNAVAEADLVGLQDPFDFESAHNSPALQPDTIAGPTETQNGFYNHITSSEPGLSVRNAPSTNTDSPFGHGLAPGLQPYHIDTSNGDTHPQLMPQIPSQAWGWQADELTSLQRQREGTPTPAPGSTNLNPAELLDLEFAQMLGCSREVIVINGGTGYQRQGELSSLYQDLQETRPVIHELLLARANALIEPEHAQLSQDCDPIAYDNGLQLIAPPAPHDSANAQIEETVVSDPGVLSGATTALGGQQQSTTASLHTSQVDIPMSKRCRKGDLRGTCRACGARYYVPKSASDGLCAPCRKLRNDQSSATRALRQQPDSAPLSATLISPEATAHSVPILSQHYAPSDQSNIGASVFDKDPECVRKSKLEGKAKHFAAFEYDVEFASLDEARVSLDKRACRKLNISNEGLEQLKTPEVTNHYGKLFYDALCAEPADPPECFSAAKKAEFRVSQQRALESIKAAISTKALAKDIMAVCVLIVEPIIFLYEYGIPETLHHMHDQMSAGRRLKLDLTTPWRDRLDLMVFAVRQDKHIGADIVHRKPLEDFVRCPESYKKCKYSNFITNFRKQANKKEQAQKPVRCGIDRGWKKGHGLEALRSGDSSTPDSMTSLSLPTRSFSRQSNNTFAGAAHSAGGLENVQQSHNRSEPLQPGFGMPRFAPQLPLGTAVLSNHCDVLEEELADPEDLEVSAAKRQKIETDLVSASTVAEPSWRNIDSGLRY